MFIYDNNARRQMTREHVDQLAQEMRRIPDPTVPGVTRPGRIRRSPCLSILSIYGCVGSVRRDSALISSASRGRIYPEGVSAPETFGTRSTP
jgi:hypothetical protein